MTTIPLDAIVIHCVSGSVDLGVARVTWRNEHTPVNRNYAKTLVLEKIAVNDGARRRGVASGIIAHLQSAATRAGRLFLVENVLSPHLGKHLERMGYRKKSGTMSGAHSYLFKGW